MCKTVLWGDTTIVAFDAIHQSFGGLGNNRTIIEPLQFPDSNSNYSEISMNVLLECPNGGCDPWDRNGLRAELDAKESTQLNSTSLGLRRLRTHLLCGAKIENLQLTT